MRLVVEAAEIAIFGEDSVGSLWAHSHLGVRHQPGANNGIAHNEKSLPCRQKL